MRRAAALALVLAGCAHGAGTGTSAHLGQRPHAALALVGLQGLGDDQASVLEDALCQALVDANHGDVSCPSSTRAALELARARAQAGGPEAATADLVQAATTLPDARVQAVVTRAGQAYVLHLEFQATPEGKPLAKRTLTASSFEELVTDAPRAARALLE